jgi:hypothetical protein
MIDMSRSYLSAYIGITQFYRLSRRVFLALKQMSPYHAVGATGVET